MKRIINSIFKSIVVPAVALAAVACDNSNEPVVNPGDEPQDPDTPYIIENNGVGEDGNIALDSVVCAYYLGNVWDTGVADYYVILSNDTIGIGSNGFEVPMHQGGWLLYLDLWSSLSADTANAVLPEGTYTYGSGRDMYCFYHEFSLATNNREQVKVDGNWLYDIDDIFFQSGTVVVEHTEGGYHITAEVVTLTGESLSFVYDGPIAFEDQSDDQEWQPVLDQDVEMQPEYVTMYKYGEYEADNCDNYVVTLFNTTELTSDGVHPNIIGGMKLLLDLYPEHGKGVEGTYGVGTLTENKYLLVKEPWVYYPGCYWGDMALGTFLEYIDTDGSVLYSVIKEGSITVTLNDNATHTISVDAVGEKGYKVTCQWSGAIAGYDYDAE